MDPKKRAAYDSSIVPEVPEVPEGDEEDFYAAHSACFVKYARWSAKQPVPELGNADTPIETVDAFYKFWYEFKSERDYSFLDEDTKEATCRDEKRHMDKENKKQRQEKKRMEHSGIRKLVDQAFELDPRIQLAKEQEKAAKHKDKKKPVAAEEAGCETTAESVHEVALQSTPACALALPVLFSSTHRTERLMDSVSDDRHL